MATQEGENPLLATLPPATDYMTYLTLLEYQLTPQNLPTLNRLLSEDDGKLAEEIGWDLLRLVLPMLKDNSEETARCLQILARRGNPREVVVRVAEELEKLGDQAEERDFEDDGDQDALPTFPGEAPRVHLGDMTLEGMPDAKKPAVSDAQGSGPSDQSHPDSIKPLQLQALFDMLSLLHPRIKTQYPSRFLATSLPAALGAYRQVPITTATTFAFLNMLGSLANKKRPPLPPRASMQGVPPSTTAAALPDPEAKAEEENTGVNVPSDAEQAIVFRLLDAVLLEVLDEYMSALAPENPSMAWTVRLREHLEPQRVVPGRGTETEQWKRSPVLVERDGLLAKFYSISKEMQLDTSQEVRKLIHEDGDDIPEDPHDEEASEYPTSPSQIPFPRAGVIYLHAYHSYLEPGDPTTLLTVTELTKLIAHSFPLSATPAIPLPALQDALLSLLYKQTLAVAAAPTTPQPSPAKFVLLLSTLTQLLAITPYPALRDAAYYIAGKLLHAYPDPAVRLRVIKQTLEGSTLSTNWAEIEDEEIGSHQPPPEPDIVEETGLTRSTSALVPHPIPLAPPQQLGQLKAIGVDWLKAEFATWIATKPTEREGGVIIISALDPIQVLLEPESAEPKQDDTTSLLDLLFPTDLSELPVTSPTAAALDDTEAADTEETLSDFLLSIPFYISTLNLISIVLPYLATAPTTSVSTLKARISRHLDSLNKSSKFLTEVLQHVQEEASGLRGGGEEEGSLFEGSRADIFALEDACARGREAWERASRA
ncbi:YAP1-binding protein 1 [Cladophialophora chaetospira]|uniref:YAP1-binding protein 1 n=1 Tax=Cladophialophora chaetospira TaxID=386627 RepID=A0AA38XHV6_9EURO|nr:YAP1-binding protein 1 [Cladophialophora chaetospira]